MDDTPGPGVLLQTERLTLRRFTVDDLDALVALDADPEVMFFVTGGLPTSRAEIRDDVLPRWISDYSDRTGGRFWAAERRETGQFFGWFHLRPRDDGPVDELELGYRLASAHWGRGLATEGARALIDYAFTARGARRVVAEAMAVHGASRRVMEKCGMHLERHFTADWPYPIPGDEHGDVEYVIDRAEWLSLGR